MGTDRPRMEQAALTCTSVVTSGHTNISIYRDREDPDIVTVLIINEQGTIVHEVDVYADGHFIDISKELARLTEVKGAK